MQENYKDYQICINEALDNAKKRIQILDIHDRRIQGMDQ